MKCVQLGVMNVVVNSVEGPEDIEYVRKILGKKGEKVQVHAKIKSLKGLENIDAILQSADGITLQRGHLSIELNFTYINSIFQHILKKCKAASKMVGLPTHVDEPGLKGASPVLSRVNDIIQSVNEGLDCLILSAETAQGEYYEESVSSARFIIEEAER